MENKEEFYNEIKKLFEFYSRKLNEEQARVYHDRLKNYTMQTIAESCRVLKSKCVKFLPSPDDVAFECDKIKSYSYQSDKLNFQKKSKDFFGQKGSTEYVQKCKDLMRKLDKNCTGIELADEMLAMDRQFPNRGWGDSARQVLADFYKRSGVSDYHRMLP